jgi:epoxide hydrolase
MTARPHTIHISDADLDDLRRRLDSTRYPAPLPGEAWSRGIDLDTLRAVVDHWRSDYDWRATEAQLNAYPHFLAEVDGVDLHFWHVRSDHPDATPLLLVHGWPGSAYEFFDLIEPLADPARSGADGPAFDVVVVEIPGFGFSGKPVDEGWTVPRIAAAFLHLMTDILGYERFGLQGGDWGGLIGTQIAAAYPDRVIGLHTSLTFALPPADADRDEVNAYRAARAQYVRHEDAYHAVQGSKPMSLAVAQADSPAGLAAWIVEKFHGWRDPRQELFGAFSLDFLVTNLMFYWAPNSVASAASIYFEVDAAARTARVDPVTVPTAILRFPHELASIDAIPDGWLRSRFSDLRISHPPLGGHFPSVEVPGSWLADVRRFFGALAT